MEAKPKLRPVSVTPDLLVAAVHSVLPWVMWAQEGGGVSPALNVRLALQKGSGRASGEQNEGQTSQRLTIIW